jgi:hypothetical protein
VSPVGYRELTHAMESKVTPDWGSGRERVATIERHGIKLLQVTIPKVHRRDSVPLGTLKHIQSDLELSPEEFDGLCQCWFDRDDFLGHLDDLVLARKKPPLPAPVEGSMSDGVNSAPYRAYELGRKRYGWSPDGDRHRAIRVHMERNPEFQWDEMGAYGNEDEARQAAALAYFAALAAQDEGEPLR